MRKTLIFTILTLLLSSTPLWAFGYNYISAEAVKTKMEQHAPLQLVDIQVAKEFQQHHLTGALASYAYPVKSDNDRAKLAALLPQLQQSTAPIVVICPRGAGGAKRAYDFLEEQGIAEERLQILEDGQQGWPYPALLAR